MGGERNPRTFAAESDLAGPQGPAQCGPPCSQRLARAGSGIWKTSGHQLGDLKNVCDPDTTWSHRPLTDLGELDSRSHFYSLPFRHGHQSQSPPPAGLHFPDSCADCVSVPGGGASGWPHAGPWSLAAPKASHQKDPKFPEDLRGRDSDPHSLVPPRGSPSGAPGPLAQPHPEVPQNLDCCTQLRHVHGNSKLKEKLRLL